MGFKDKKHITRQGKHDEKSRYGTSKKGVAYYVYYDLDAHGYRTATTIMESEALMNGLWTFSCNTLRFYFSVLQFVFS